jgi:hypothetical protein
MRKVILISLVLTALFFIFSGCERKVYVVEPDTTPPSSPKGVYCVTGNKAVYIYWERNDESDFYRYKIYWAPETDGIIPEPDDDFELITSIPNPPQYTDTDVENGTTYYYVITAVDNSGNESEPSKILYDTPRPDGYNILFNVAIDNSHAGIYFDNQQGVQIVSRTSPLCDVYLDSYDRVFYLNTTMKDSIPNDIQDFGFTNSLDEINVAPDTNIGWSELDYIPVWLGHTYAIWTWDNHYAKLRVTDIDTIYYNYIRFEWAYQTAEGNPELKVVPKRIANKK